MKIRGAFSLKERKVEANRKILIGVGALAALALIIVLFVRPGVITDRFGGDDEVTVAVQPTATPATGGDTATTKPPVAPTQAPSSLPQTGGGGQLDTTIIAQQAMCPGDHEVKAGETFQVPPGCNVKGDVVVNGQQFYGGDPTTGLIVSCPNGCTIFAQWGANVTPRGVDDLNAEMLASGCGSRCASVKVVVIGEKVAPPVAVGRECDFSIEAGGSTNVPSGCVVSGDVTVNGKVLFDNNPKTGLIVVITELSVVEAPFGASVTAQGPNPQATVDQIKKSMETNGCGFAGRGGCSQGVMVVRR